MSTVESGRENSENYESLTESVLAVIADLEGMTPAEIEPPLYEILDPDALNALFAPTNAGVARTEGQVVVTYCGYEVTIHSDGRVVAEEPDEE